MGTRSRWAVAVALLLAAAPARAQLEPLFRAVREDAPVVIALALSPRTYAEGAGIATVVKGVTARVLREQLAAFGTAAGIDPQKDVYLVAAADPAHPERCGLAGSATIDLPALVKALKDGGQVEPGDLVESSKRAELFVQKPLHLGLESGGRFFYGVPAAIEVARVNADASGTPKNALAADLAARPGLLFGLAATVEPGQVPALPASPIADVFRPLVPHLKGATLAVTGEELQLDLAFDAAAAVRAAQVQLTAGFQQLESLFKSREASAELEARTRRGAFAATDPAWLAARLAAESFRDFRARLKVEPAGTRLALRAAHGLAGPAASFVPLLLPALTALALPKLQAR